MAKNITILAEGLAGDNEGRVLGYNDTNFGYKAPIIGTCERDSIATYIGKDGLLKTAPPNTLRVDYTNGVAEMLLEPASTNYVEYSNDLTEWNQVTGSYSSSLNGTDDLGNDSYNVSLGNDSIARVLCSIPNGVSSVRIRVKGIQGEVISYGLNGYVVDHTFSGDWEYMENLNVSVSSVSELRLTNFTINATANNFQVSIAQVEPLSYPTSYIPTNGSIATRQADSLTNFGFEQVIDSESGILFFEGSMFPSPTTTQISLNEGNANSRMGLRFQEGANIITAIQRKDGASVVANYSLGSEANLKDNVKVAVRYSGSLMEIIYSGVAENSNTIIPFTSGSLNNLSFNDGSLNSNIFYGRIRQLKHLPFNTDILSL